MTATSPVGDCDVRPLLPADVPACDAHFARHRAESGRGDIHFMPFAPGEDAPAGLDSTALDLDLDTPGWQRWFVALAQGGELVVGQVNLKGGHLRTGLHRCELGIGIERGYRGQGLGQRLMARAIEFARQAESIDWLDLKVFAHNIPARALYGKLGFVEIGIVSDRFRIAGTTVDDVLMTLDVSARRR